MISLNDFVLILATVSIIWVIVISTYSHLLIRRRSRIEADMIIKAQFYDYVYMAMDAGKMFMIDEHELLTLPDDIQAQIKAMYNPDGKPGFPRITRRRKNG